MFGRNESRLAAWCLRSSVLGLAMVVLSALSAHAQPGPAALAPLRPNGGWGAAWSPRGDQLAFLSSLGGLPAEAWVCDREGKAFRRLTHGGADELSWSRDAHLLRFTTTRRGRYERWQVDVLTDQESPTPVPAHVPAGALWEASPDGRSVAFVPGEGKSHDLYLLRPGETKPAPVTADFDVNSFAWSPRGDTIAFDGVNPLSHGLPQVWAYTLASKKLAHLGSAGSYGPVWSAKGDLLAYRVLYSGSGDRIATATPNGKLGKLLKDVLSPGDGLSWGPRSGLLTVAVRGEKQREVWLVTPEGVVKTKLSRPDLAMRYPTWSPDGKWLAVEGLQQGTSAASEVWVTDAAGKEWRNLVPSRPSVWALSPARQGRLFLLSNAAGVSRVCAAGGDGAPVLAGTEYARQVAADPARDWLAVLMANSLALYTTEGAALGTQALPGVSEVQWSPQGDRLAAAGRDRAGADAIKLLSVSAEGALAEVATIAGRSPAWRAEGVALAFVRDTEIWQADREGAHEVKLAALPSAEGEALVVGRLRFDAAGETLAVDVTRQAPAGGQRELWVIRAGQANKLYSEPVTTQFGLTPDRYGALPAWTADGRILFTSDRGGSPQVWSLRADGSDLLAVTPAESVWATVAPDGATLSFVRLDQDEPLWKASTDGSGLSPVPWKQP